MSAESFTAGDRLKAEWAAKVFQESGRSRTTARGLHYFALGRTDFPVFSRSGLKKTRAYRDKDANNLTEWIALAKRLGLIPWDAVPDQSVGEYGELEYVPSREDFSYSYSLGRPDLREFVEYLQRSTPVVEYSPVERPQPFHLELWVEKSTMNGMLQPVCERYNAVLVTFRGHASWGAAWKLCKRVDADGRPAIVLYLSDMDASGFLMCHELCDKVAEINSNFFNGRLDIRIKRTGLTPQQVVEYQIPLVPRNDGEKANADLYRQYVESCGLDPTMKAELDALERYYSGGIEAFVSKWLDKYYDSGLDRRCNAATEECVDLIPAGASLPEDIVRARRELLCRLEDLLKSEREIELPAGGEIESDVEAETDDPDGEPWLLDTLNGAYPGECDVDHVEVVA
mgnify:FL=1|jgi:hypothetical protein